MAKWLIIHCAIWLLCNAVAVPMSHQLKGRPGREISLPCKSRGGVEGVCMSTLNCLKLMGTIVDRCSDQSASCCSKAVSSDSSSLSNGIGSFTTTFSSRPNAPLLSPATASNNSTNEDPDYKKICGKPKMQSRAGRIVGGFTAAVGQWPWQISLNKRNGTSFSHSCGASLLNEYWAITAAHCVRSENTGDILLRIGLDDLDVADKADYVERRVSLVVIHPRYRSITFDNDLALLRFTEPVRFQSNIVPICLPEGNPDFVGQMAFVSGWGRLKEDGPLPSKLQHVSVPVMDNTKCEKTYLENGFPRENFNVFICAGNKEGKQDSCKGDSGGPMVVRQNGRWILAGVTSWGLGCARADRPGVYSRITESRDWINKFIAVKHLDASTRPDIFFTKLLLLP